MNSVRDLLVVGVQRRSNSPSPGDAEKGDHKLDLQAVCGAHRHSRQLSRLQHDSMQVGATLTCKYSFHRIGVREGDCIAWPNAAGLQHASKPHDMLQQLRPGHS